MADDNISRTLQKFYFPITLHTPMLHEEHAIHGPYSVIVCNRRPSLEDFAILGHSHDLQGPLVPGLLHMLFDACNMEIGVAATSLEEAKELFAAFRVGAAAAYCDEAEAHWSPFTSPFVSTHSMSDCAGIFFRDHPEQANGHTIQYPHGLKSVDGKITVWPLELTFEFMVCGTRAITNPLFTRAAEGAEIWSRLIDTEKRKSTKNRPLTAFQQASIAASTIRPLSQSYLHLWTGIEAIFPKVSTEVSFRLALYLAQMNASRIGELRKDYYRHAKTQYDLRSTIAHGSRTEISIEEWTNAWKLVINSAGSIIQRKGLPSEDDLLTELLADPVAAVETTEGETTAESADEE